LQDNIHNANETKRNGCICFSDKRGFGFVIELALNGTVYDK